MNYCVLTVGPKGGTGEQLCDQIGRGSSQSQGEASVLWTGSINELVHLCRIATYRRALLVGLSLDRGRHKSY